MDDDWLLQEVEDKEVRIRNIRTDHVAVLGFDQITDYVADPKLEFDGLRLGFLELRVQVFLRGAELVIEPRPSSPRARVPRTGAPTRKRKTV